MQLDYFRHAHDYQYISIHAPYKGCNSAFSRSISSSVPFQSMHPIKDATNS